MSRTEQVELAVLCLIENGTQMLLQNRRKADWKGYTLPGGHVEQGESFVQAVIREMKEETGLTIKHPVLCGVKQFPISEGRYVVLLFKTNEYEGTLVSSDEGDMEWIERSMLHTYPIVEDFDELLKIFDDTNLTEFQYVIRNEEFQVNLF